MNPDNSRTIQRIFVDLKSLSFTPHMVEDALYLVKRWRLPIEVEYDKVFVEFNSFLEHSIWDEYSRPA